MPNLNRLASAHLVRTGVGCVQRRTTDDGLFGGSTALLPPVPRQLVSKDVCLLPRPVLYVPKAPPAVLEALVRDCEVRRVD
jgi:hypothetical protein